MNRNGIAFTDTQVSEVASFLRVINAIDNIENSALRGSDRALQALDLDPNPDDVINRILEIAVADTDDAVQVLNEGGLHNSGGLPINAVKQLEKAKKRLQPNASDTARKGKVVSAEEYLRNALGLMRFGTGQTSFTNGRIPRGSSGPGRGAGQRPVGPDRSPHSSDRGIRSSDR